MFQMLTLIVQANPSTDATWYEIEVAVYDGTLYVASKVWQVDDLQTGFSLARAFHLAWSCSYFDQHLPPPQPPTEAGDQQLPLPF